MSDPQESAALDCREEVIHQPNWDILILNHEFVTEQHDPNEVDEIMRDKANDHNYAFNYQSKEKLGVKQGPLKVSDLNKRSNNKVPLGKVKIPSTIPISGLKIK